MTLASQDHREQVFLVIAAVAAAATGLVWLTSGSSTLFLVMRWLVLLTLVVYASFRRSLTAWIFVFMLLGAEIGHDLPGVATNLRVLALIFLRLIKTIIAPLLFATLVVGIAGHSNLRQIGRLALRSIIYFELVTTIALVIGLAAINLAKPGVGVQLPAITANETSGIGKLSAEDTILHAFPENIAKAVAENAVLEVVIFSLIFAIALRMIDEDKRRPMLAFCEGLAAVMFKFTNIVMLLAPIGVGAAVAYRSEYRAGRTRQSSEAAGHVLRCALRLYSRSSITHRTPVRGTGARLYSCRRRARDHRVRHDQLRSGSASRLRGYGIFRRAATNRRVRYSHRL